MAHGTHGGHAGEEAHTEHSHTDAGPAGFPEVDALDPVCGMLVPPDTGYVKPFQARMLRFCSRRCLDTFEAAPERFLARAGGIR
jgi:YHS domain-containing protein